MPTRKGSVHLFSAAGIDLYLHWSWFVVALIEISYRSQGYTSILWNGLEYVALFGLVLMHEFGHALACRQVGGRANQIVLWPLGGVAYVAPPPRPGATLWSIAAGPLVNLALLPVLTGLVYFSREWAWAAAMPNFHTLLMAIWIINVGLLVFNLLPIYPLDGGQILHSLLWYLTGRARSLMITAGIGLVGVVGIILIAFYLGSIWMGILGVFIALNCWRGFQVGRMLAALEQAPRRDGFRCPACSAAPIIGELWQCPRCAQRFDLFAGQGVCPHCQGDVPVAACVGCGRAHAIAEWVDPAVLTGASNSRSF